MSEQDYYGTKRVTAWPEVRGNQEPGGDDLEGYAVRYADGYTSWSPKAAFEAAYKPVTAMDFSGALAAMKDGGRVRRPGWKPGRAIRYASGNKTWQPGFWWMVDGQDNSGWTCPIEDVVADDWMITTDT